MNEQMLMETYKDFLEQLVQGGDAHRLHKFLDEVMDVNMAAAERVLVAETGLPG